MAYRRGLRRIVLPTDPTVVAAGIVTEADCIRAEMQAMFEGLNGRHPSKAMMRRARELRERAQALGAVAESLLLQEMAIEIAVRQRLGRSFVEGEEITPADEAGAEQILAGLRLC